jgi:hypothetical protein
MPKSANTPRTDKRKAPKTAWKPGQSGNPAGRPKDGESWAAVIKAVGEMYPDDLLVFIPKGNDLGNAISQLPKGVQMKYLVTARVFAALMFEPSSGLWKELMERAEGKVQEKVDITSNGKEIGQDDEFRAAILRKLGGITRAGNPTTMDSESDK